MKITTTLLIAMIIAVPGWLGAQSGIWSQETASAGWSGRNNHSSLVFNNKMWVIGGGNYTNDVWTSTDGGNWSQETASAGWAARNGHATAVFNSKIWVLGGRTQGGYVNDVWSSSDGITWTQETSAAGWSGRSKPACAVFNNKLWIIGGVSRPNGNWTQHNDVWSSTDGINWTLETSSPGWSTRQLGYDTAVFDSKIWVFNYSSADDVWSSSDGVNWTQEMSTTPWTALYNYATAVFNNRLWLLGGNGGSGSYDDVWSSSDGVNWTLQNSSPGWSGRANPTVLGYGGKLYVMGGFDGSHRNDVWSYEELSITSPGTLPDGTENVAYSQTLTASGGTQPYAWYEGTPTGGMVLPSGWTIDPSSGELTASSPAPGTYNFDIYVQDGVSATATASFSVTVQPAGSSLSITTQGSLPGGTMGVTYLAPVNASGGGGTLSWSVISGALPDGTQLVGNGSSADISGLPTKEGTFGFVLEITDGSATAQKSMTIKIDPAPGDTTTVGGRGGGGSGCAGDARGSTGWIILCLAAIVAAAFSAPRRRRRTAG